MLVDTLSIDDLGPIRSFNESNTPPEDVLKYSLMSDISSGYKLMYYSQAYDGWLYLDSFEILQHDDITVFHYKASSALISANIIDRRTFEGWTTITIPTTINPETLKDDMFFKSWNEK